MQTKQPVFVSSSGKQIFRRATARESLLSIVVAWINIYLRNAYTRNLRKQITSGLPELEWQQIL